ncbi:MAG: hypothetical protein ACRC2X_15520 [Giesbergeria sp.]
MNATTPSGHAAASPDCTCPSGDGSLRWPCPQHTPTPAPAASATANAWLHAVDGYAGWHEMHTWATAITHATAAAFADGAPARAQALNDALHYILERQTDIIESELAQCRAAHDAAKRGLEN